MHDVMRARLMRKLEALPEERLYQVLDYIEFLESKHSPAGPSRGRGLQGLAERLEDGLRTRRLSPRTIGRAMTVVGTAGRVVDTVAAAGREAVRTGRALLAEVESAAPARREGRGGRDGVRAEEDGSDERAGADDPERPVAPTD